MRGKSCEKRAWEFVGNAFLVTTPLLPAQVKLSEMISGRVLHNRVCPVESCFSLFSLFGNRTLHSLSLSPCVYACVRALDTHFSRNLVAECARGLQSC